MASIARRDLPVTAAQPAYRTPADAHFAEWGVYFLLVGVITVRVFTEMVPVLPRVFNAFDYFALPGLIIVCVASLILQKRERLHGGRIIRLVLIFLAAWGISWIANASEVHWISGLLLMAGLLSPVVFYLIGINIGLNATFGKKLLRLMQALLVVNLIVGSVQAVQAIGTGGVDVVYGTFGVNIDQFAFFLIVMIAYYASQWIYSERPSWLSLVVMGWTGVLFLVASFQTLWIVAPIAGVIVLARGRKLPKRSIPGLAIAAVLMVLGWPLVPTARFDVLAKVKEAITEFDDLGKVELLRNVPEVWAYQPSSLLVGVGPGTFNSRAFRSIAKIPYIHYVNGVPVEDVSAAIMEPFYETDIANQFIIPYFTRGFYRLSGPNTDAPFTSFVSVPIEIGLPGALAFFLIYAIILRRLDNSLRSRCDTSEKVLAAWSMCSMLMLLGLAFIDNSLEVTRYTFVAWTPVVLWSLKTMSRARLQPAVARPMPLRHRRLR